MIKTITFAALMLCSTLLHAQQYFVKAYATGNFTSFHGEHTTRTFGMTQHIDDVRFLSPSVAVTKKNKRGNFHELELSMLDVRKMDIKTQFTQPVTGIKYYELTSRLTRSIIAARYEYIVSIGKKKHWMVQPSIGFAAMPYFDRYRSTPYINADYPVTQTYIGVRSFVVPRITVPLTRRLSLDANIPITVADMSYIRENIADPALPVSAQRYGVLDFSMFSNYITARLGLSMRL